MFFAIVSHTPVWVWSLLAALVALGLAQTRARDASLVRVTVLPVAMLALSFFGVRSAFGLQPLAVASWLAGVGVAIAVGRGAVAVRGATWSAATRTVRLPGSWLPLALIVAIFALKYAAGISLGLHPSLAADRTFSTGFSLAYGVFSGLFLARALSLRAVVGSGRNALQPA